MAKKEGFNPIVMGARQLEWHLTETLCQKFGSVSYYWSKEGMKSPINILRGKTESFVMEAVDEHGFFPKKYKGTVAANADGTLKINLSITELLESGMKRTITYEIY